MYADIAFPLKLHSLTYKIPEGASTYIKGRIVKASIGGRPELGLVVSVSAEPPVAKKRFREIEEVYGLFGSEGALPLISWLADYYVSTIGMALKSCFFEEVAQLILSGIRPNEDVEAGVMQGSYAAMLYHAGSTKEELSLIRDTISDAKGISRGIIVLVPEAGFLERAASPLLDICGERLCILHSKLTKKKRMSAIERIISGDADIVLGTRSAIFAPLRQLSFISVAAEHSQAYKGEEGIRYNSRDAAVMRGFIEKSPVMLSSICPSLESVYNSMTGKYAVLSAKDFRVKGLEPLFATAVRSAVEKKQEAPRPAIEIVNIQGKSAVSPFITKQAKNILSADGRFLFYVNRHGYSLIRCEECGYMPRCSRCLVPLVFSKSGRMLKCGYCAAAGPVPTVCPDCKSLKLSFFGAGTEKVKEEVEKILGTEAHVLEKKPGRLSPKDDASGFSFVVGTAYARRKVKEQMFDAAAFVNIDAVALQPDFRAHEKAFQEAIELCQILKPDGTLYIQTGDMNKPEWKMLRSYDFRAFYNHELAQRKSLDYPPFSRITLLTIRTKKVVADLYGKLYALITSIEALGVEILGPIEKPAAKGCRQQFQILLKGKDSRTIQSAARDILEKAGGIKDVEAFADTNPYKI
ncbi:MAG: primosomal protein N' [Nitrospirae bacterium]|nr:primosomal protein N' [Nitrospirota bacterium]